AAPDCRLSQIPRHSQVTKELSYETAWIGERDQMPALQLFKGEMESFSRDAPLKIEWKEPIVTPGDDMDGHVGPPVEFTWLAEHDVSLAALACFPLLADLGRNVVQEVGGHVEGRAVPAALRGRGPSGRRSRVLPPLSGRLAGDRNHGVDEHQHAHANPRADQGCCETGERLHDEDHVARSDGIDDTVGIRREAGVFVVTRQIAPARVVRGLFEERRDAMPVPRHAASTGNKNKCSHGNVFYYGPLTVLVRPE